MTITIKESLDAEPILKYFFLLIKWVLILSFWLAWGILTIIFANFLLGSNSTHCPGNYHPNWKNM